MNETTVLAAASTLYAKLLAGADPAAVTVQFGPVKSGAWRDNVIVVAWSTDDRPAYQVETRAPGGLRDNSQESWQISCVVSAVIGHSVDTVRRADEAAAALLDTVRTVLAADMTLDGACGYAFIGSELNWWHANTGKGVESTLTFDVVGRSI